MAKKKQPTQELVLASLPRGQDKLPHATTLEAARTIIAIHQDTIHQLSQESYESKLAAQRWKDKVEEVGRLHDERVKENRELKEKINQIQKILGGE